MANKYYCIDCHIELTDAEIHNKRHTVMLLDVKRLSDFP